MKKNCLNFLLTLFAIITVNIAKADEGMWLPIFLDQGPEAEMRRLGMKINAEDIYSVNKACLKDAVVHFGGGCTAELISDEGLILTNHHCGYSAIQAHSSLEADYMTNGFWAKTKKEELINKGLQASILIRMEDVTQKVLANVDPKMNEIQRQTLINMAIGTIEGLASKGNKYKIEVKSFNYGNQFIMVVYEVFKDVRLVGAPPSSMGKFGGDTDNWVWPRHTADFSLFRIYADKDNKPAEYSEDNIPYKPKYSFKISLKGVKKDDFTFVFGYPGETNEYLTSFAVNKIAFIENPAMIKIRQKRLEIFDKYMKGDKLTRLQYSAKYATVANYWKKMMGESLGIKRLNTVENKKLFEAEFQDWTIGNEERKNKYGNLINDFEAIYSELTPLSLAFDYLYEAGLGVELIKFAYNFNKIWELSTKKNISEKELTDVVDQVKASAKGFFKNYNVNIDKEVFSEVIKYYCTDLKPEFIPDTLKYYSKKFNGDYKLLADYVYKTSNMTSLAKVEKLLDKYTVKKVKNIEKDPAFIISKDIYKFYYNALYKKIVPLDTKLEELYRIYTAGIAEMNSNKKFYPDANSTLRIAYGKVDGYIGPDAVIYDYFTTLDGVIAKEDTSIYDYIVDKKLKDMWQKKDYGRYADSDGKMHVCFIANNHTTGGNSGSPVLNAEGHLIGINFDRVWEGTMSDIVYDPAKCRNISLDIRYCLFIIDKYAGATNLINEMKFAE
jgi:hypothetical protein